MFEKFPEASLDFKFSSNFSQTPQRKHFHLWFKEPKYKESNGAACRKARLCPWRCGSEWEASRV